MTSRCRPYLLETPAQISAFRKKYARVIQVRGPVWVKWISSLRWMEWTRLTIPEGREEEIIGLICILYIDGYVNICFNDGDNSEYYAIRRVPASEEENNEWIKQFKTI